MSEEIKKKFQELYSKNVTEYIEQKNGLNYLTWSYAWAEFKKVYPDATYEVKKDSDGRCYFGDKDIGYMCYTSVTAGGLAYEMWLPVMDGANKAMKTEPYTYKTKFGDKAVESLTMFDVNKTIMRCLVKNLAMFGLGLYIYAGEDLPEDITEHTCSECGKIVDSAMAKRTEKAFGTVLCKECGLKKAGEKENG